MQKAVCPELYHYHVYKYVALVLMSVYGIGYVNFSLGWFLDSEAASLPLARSPIKHSPRLSELLDESRLVLKYKPLT